jgi:hypothetical protein
LRGIYREVLDVFEIDCLTDFRVDLRGGWTLDPLERTEADLSDFPLEL